MDIVLVCFEGRKCVTKPTLRDLSMSSFMRIAALLLALIAQCDGLVLGARSASLAPRTSLVRLEAPPPPPKGKLGATIDQDGKSNVWVSTPLTQAHQHSTVRSDCW